MLVSRVIRRAGYRVTACIGGLFLGLGEFTAEWSTGSVGAMFVTQGLVYAGAGVGPAVIAVSMEGLIRATDLETALKILGTSAWAICLPASYSLRAPAGSARALSSIQWSFPLWT